MKPYTRQDALEEEEHALTRGDLRGALAAAAEVDRLNRLDPHSPVTVLAAALWYASVGLKVFPLVHGGKTPLPRTRGVHDATNDQARVRQLFGHHHGPRPTNVGIATGHLIDVLDFDGPEAHAAWGARWPAWSDAGVTLLASVSTPRAGGMHVYVPATGKGNRAAMVPGVDYRGRGGYVVAPPSWTPDGRYVFAASLDVDKMHHLAQRARRYG